MPVRFADVEPAVVQRESVRMVELVEQRAHGVRLAVAVGVALEQHDFVGPRAGHDEVAGRGGQRPAGEGHVGRIHLEPEAVGNDAASPRPARHVGGSMPRPSMKSSMTFLSPTCTGPNQT